jgi:hypothetical protein
MAWRGETYSPYFFCFWLINPSLTFDQNNQNSNPKWEEWTIQTITAHYSCHKKYDLVEFRGLHKLNLLIKKIRIWLRDAKSSPLASSSLGYKSLQIFRFLENLTKLSCFFYCKFSMVNKRHPYEFCEKKLCPLNLGWWKRNEWPQRCTSNA